MADYVPYPIFDLPNLNQSWRYEMKWLCAKHLILCKRYMSDATCYINVYYINFMFHSQVYYIFELLIQNGREGKFWSVPKIWRSSLFYVTVSNVGCSLNIIFWNFSSDYEKCFRSYFEKLDIGKKCIVLSRKSFIFFDGLWFECHQYFVFYSFSRIWYSDRQWN